MTTVPLMLFFNHVAMSLLCARLTVYMEKSQWEFFAYFWVRVRVTARDRTKVYSIFHFKKNYNECSLSAYPSPQPTD